MRAISVVLGMGVLAGCPADERDVAAVPTVADDDRAAQIERGRTVYSTPLADGNVFACATCHALEEPAADGLRRPGHPLGDAYARGSYKNGAVSSLLEAAQSCQEEWMNAEPWAPEDADWLALETFLASAAPDTAEPLSFEIRSPGDIEGGDPDAGRDVYEATCTACHAVEGQTSPLAPTVVGLGLDSDYIARRVRTSGRTDGIYAGLTGGVMPFWSAERLSDAELRDVVAYVGQAVEEPDEPADTGLAPIDMNAPACGSADHPKVGQLAELQDFFHDVGGTAEIIDDCSVRITDFTFDGQGIDVRIYGGLGGDYDSGFSMSEDDLRRAQPYVGETLYATLPPGRTWDDVDGISVWCVPIGIDFGSGLFE